MTLLEYIQSLQDQNLSQEEIFAKAQEWKKNNPQPEVEEEVEETIEQAPVEESSVMFGTKTDGFGSKQFMLDAMNNVTTDFMGNRFVKVSKEEQINNVLSNFKVGSDERKACVAANAVGNIGEAINGSSLVTMDDLVVVSFGNIGEAVTGIATPQADDFTILGEGTFALAVTGTANIQLDDFVIYGRETQEGGIYGAISAMPIEIEEINAIPIEVITK